MQTAVTNPGSGGAPDGSIAGCGGCHSNAAIVASSTGGCGVRGGDMINQAGGRVTVSQASGKPGDWKCLHCGNMNYSSRQACNGCAQPIGNAVRIGMEQGDWICPACGDLVFASKSACKICQTPKPVVPISAFQNFHSS